MAVLASNINATTGFSELVAFNLTMSNQTSVTITADYLRAFVLYYFVTQQFSATNVSLAVSDVVSCSSYYSGDNCRALSFTPGDPTNLWYAVNGSSNVTSVFAPVQPPANNLTSGSGAMLLTNGSFSFLASMIYYAQPFASAPNGDEMEISVDFNSLVVPPALQGSQQQAEGFALVMFDAAYGPLYVYNVSNGPSMAITGSGRPYVAALFNTQANQFVLELRNASGYTNSVTYNLSAQLYGGAYAQGTLTLKYSSFFQLFTATISPFYGLSTTTPVQISLADPGGVVGLTVYYAVSASTGNSSLLVAQQYVSNFEQCWSGPDGPDVYPVPPTACDTTNTVNSLGCYNVALLMPLVDNECGPFSVSESEDCAAYCYYTCQSYTFMTNDVFNFTGANCICLLDNDVSGAYQAALAQNQSSCTPLRATETLWHGPANLNITYSRYADVYNISAAGWCSGSCGSVLIPIQSGCFQLYTNSSLLHAIYEINSNTTLDVAATCYNLCSNVSLSNSSYIGLAEKNQTLIECYCFNATTFTSTSQLNTTSSLCATVAFASSSNTGLDAAATSVWSGKFAHSAVALSYITFAEDCRTTDAVSCTTYTNQSALLTWDVVPGVVNWTLSYTAVGGSGTTQLAILSGNASSYMVPAGALAVGSYFFYVVGDNKYGTQHSYSLQTDSACAIVNGFDSNYTCEPSGVWRALGTPTQDALTIAAFAPNGLVYYGGAFIASGGVGALQNIAAWNPSSSSWSELVVYTPPTPPTPPPTPAPTPPSSQILSYANVLSDISNGYTKGNGGLCGSDSICASCACNAAFECAGDTPNVGNISRWGYTCTLTSECCYPTTCVSGICSGKRYYFPDGMFSTPPPAPTPPNPYLTLTTNGTVYAMESDNTTVYIIGNFPLGIVLWYPGNNSWDVLQKGALSLSLLDDVQSLSAIDPINKLLFVACGTSTLTDHSGTMANSSYSFVIYPLSTHTLDLQANWISSLHSIAYNLYNTPGANPLLVWTAYSTNLTTLFTMRTGLLSTFSRCIQLGGTAGNVNCTAVGYTGSLHTHNPQNGGVWNFLPISFVTTVGFTIYPCIIEWQTFVSGGNTLELQLAFVRVQTSPSVFYIQTTPANIALAFPASLDVNLSSVSVTGVVDTMQATTLYLMVVLTTPGSPTYNALVTVPLADIQNVSSIAGSAVAISQDGALSLVNDMVYSAGQLYFAGLFASNTSAAALVINDTKIAYNVASGSWQTLWDAGVYTEITAMAVISDNQIYISGNFHDQFAPNDVTHFAQWNGHQWSAIGTASAPTGAANVLATALVHGTASLVFIYAGGSFTSCNGNCTNCGTNICWFRTGFSTQPWVVVGNGTNAEVNAIVVDLGNQNPYNLYAMFIGGLFTQIQNGTAINYCAWTLIDDTGATISSDLASYGPNWFAMGNGTAGGVYAMAIAGYANSTTFTSVYVGGAFGNVYQSNGAVLGTSHFLFFSLKTLFHSFHSFSKTKRRRRCRAVDVGRSKQRHCQQHWLLVSPGRCRTRHWRHGARDRRQLRAWSRVSRRSVPTRHQRLQRRLLGAVQHVLAPVLGAGRLRHQRLRRVDRCAGQRRVYRWRVLARQPHPRLVLRRGVQPDRGQLDHVWHGAARALLQAQRARACKACSANTCAYTQTDSCTDARTHT